MKRRNFIKTSALAIAGAGLLSSELSIAKSKDKVRLGFIGVGLRGRGHVELCLDRKDVEIVSICDIRETSLAPCRQLFKDKGRALPMEYTGGPDAYKRMYEHEQLDAVIIATPWQYHNSQSIDGLKAGIYVGCEVIAGLTEDEHWDLVETSEKTGIPYMCLENVNYRQDVLAVLNMVRKGVFGEVVHLEGGYQHDLRALYFNDGTYYNKGTKYGEEGFGEAQWRTQFNIDLNGDLYPTHGFGPVMNYGNINHGNRVISLASFASKAKGLAAYLEEVSPGHPYAKLDFKNGDIITTVMTCANGETIVITHDTHLPRPYSTGLKVQGTKGLWMELNNGIFLDTDGPHSWKKADEVWSKYDHFLWKNHVDEAKNTGHGGADWFVIDDFLKSVKQGAQTPFDVYDSATLNAVFPLSIASIAQGGKVLDFPDFTKGAWKTRKPTFALDEA